MGPGLSRMALNGFCRLVRFGFRLGHDCFGSAERICLFCGQVRNFIRHRRFLLYRGAVNGIGFRRSRDIEVHHIHIQFLFMFIHIIRRIEHVTVILRKRVLFIIVHVNPTGVKRKTSGGIRVFFSEGVPRIVIIHRQIKDRLFFGLRFRLQLWLKDIRSVKGLRGICTFWCRCRFRGGRDDRFRFIFQNVKDFGGFRIDFGVNVHLDVYRFVVVNRGGCFGFLRILGRFFFSRFSRCFLMLFIVFVRFPFVLIFFRNLFKDN